MITKKIVLSIIMSLIIVTIVYSQSIDSNLKLNSIASSKRTLTFSVLQGVTSDPVAMDYMQFDVGYFIFKNSELGISVGKEDSPSGNDFVMIGVYYTHYIEESFHAGFRVELPGEYSPSDINTYNEIFLGNNFPITNNFNLRMRISYSYLSKTFLGLNWESQIKKLGFQAGFNYLF